MQQNIKNYNLIFKELIKHNKKINESRFSFNKINENNVISEILVFLSNLYRYR